MREILKKYKLLILMASIVMFILLINYECGKHILTSSIYSISTFFKMLIPIFIITNLLDIWVPREVMIKFIGEGSKFKGACISLALGLITAVPIYAIFPIVTMLLRKGGKISNVLIFLCSSVVIRIPLILFEVSSLGIKFAFTRFFLNFFVVLIIPFIIEKLLSEKDKKDIYINSQNI